LAKVSGVVLQNAHRAWNVWEVLMITFIWRNIWLRYSILLALGVSIYLGGISENDDAKKYEGGPKEVDVESLSAKNLEYDYLTLTGLNDSYFLYAYFSEGKDKEKIDKDKAIILYYALHTLEELDASIAGEQSRPTVLVRQVLPEEQRACVESEDGCLTGGEMTLTGQLTKERPFEGDDEKEAFTKLAEGGLYTVDENTLYLNADWDVPTESNASITKGLGVVWTGLSALGLAFSWNKRRKRKLAELAITNDQELVSQDRL
jgi:hypothetical protein